MKIRFKDRALTGLKKNSRIDLAGAGAAASTYIVVDGIPGVSTWEGFRIYDKQDGTGSWKATKGQQGPRKGKIKLRLAGQSNTSSKIVDAEFEIKWEPVFFIETDNCRLPGGSAGHRKPGKLKRLNWEMHVRRILKVNGVQYERIIKSITNIASVNGPCKPR